MAVQCASFTTGIVVITPKNELPDNFVNRN